MKNVLIIGMGKSGIGADRFLQSMGVKTTTVDQNSKGSTLSDVVKINPFLFDLVVLSPGIAPSHPLCLLAESHGVEMIGEIELGCRFLNQPCIGVTGTNGKTTVVNLVTHGLISAGKKARAVGNIGVSLCEYLLNPNPEEILVLELSSFQLETMKTSCLDAAAIINITPDHLDRYATFTDYGLAKCCIANCLKNRGNLFLGERIDPVFMDHLPPASIFSKEENREIAYALCSTFGVSELEFTKALTTFQRPEHRVEFVKTIHGISFYNDSKGTNIDSVIYAVGQFNINVVLIVGGLEKNTSFEQWIEPFRNKVSHIFAIGSAREKIFSTLKGSFSVEKVAELKDAIYLAYSRAEKGGIVLLSPGCASFDQFHSFEDRGKKFKQWVLDLEE